MHALVFLPIAIFATTAIATGLICLMIEVNERKRISRQRRLSSRRHNFRPVLIQSGAAWRQAEFTQRPEAYPAKR